MENTERGRGYGKGSGNGFHGGRNRGKAFGTGGFCICPKCGEKLAHRRGVKCTTVRCPKCDGVMVREEMVS